MTRIALTVGIAWGIAALVVWAWIRAATRPIPALRYVEPEDGVQPWDWYSLTRASPTGNSAPYTFVLETPIHDC